MIKRKRCKLLVKRCLILVHSNITNSEPHFFSNTRPDSSFAAIFIWLEIIQSVPDSKFRGANMELIWVLSAPDGPHVGPMKLAIRGSMYVVCRDSSVCMKHFVHRKNFSLWLLLAYNTDMQSGKHPGRSSDSCLCNITWVHMVLRFWRVASKSRNSFFFIICLDVLYSINSLGTPFDLLYKHI